MLGQFSLCKKLNLLNSLCFPCLEKLTAKFPIFPVPSPPWYSIYHSTSIRPDILHMHLIKYSLLFKLEIIFARQAAGDRIYDKLASDRPELIIANMYQIVSKINILFILAHLTAQLCYCYQCCDVVVNLILMN